MLLPNSNPRTALRQDGSLLVILAAECLCSRRATGQGEGGCAHKRALCFSSTASQRGHALGRWDSIRPNLPASLDWLWDRVYTIRDPGPTARVCARCLYLPAPTLEPAGSQTPVLHQKAQGGLTIVLAQTPDAMTLAHSLLLSFSPHLKAELSKRLNCGYNAFCWISNLKP